MIQLKARLALELPAINRALDKAVDTLPEPVRPITRHIFQAGGKRLRPLLTVLTATDARPDRSGGMVLPSLRPVTVIEGGHGRPGVRLHGVQSSAPVQSRAQAHRHRRRRSGCRCAIP